MKNKYRRFAEILSTNQINDKLKEVEKNKEIILFYNEYPKGQDRFYVTMLIEKT